MSNHTVPKFVTKLGCYRRKKGPEDCLVALSIYDRCEYVSVTSTGPVFAHVCNWTQFHEEFEPSNFDIAKVHAMLMRRAERQGASVRAKELLVTTDPARIPEGEVEMASTKKSPKPVAKKAAAVEAKAAPAKSTKKAAPAPVEKAGPGRKSAFNDGMKITVLVKENPKRAKAAERFALYKNGLTIADYVAAGGTLADVRWDVKQSFISVK